LQEAERRDARSHHDDEVKIWLFDRDRGSYLAWVGVSREKHNNATLVFREEGKISVEDVICPIISLVF